MKTEELIEKIEKDVMNNLIASVSHIASNLGMPKIKIAEHLGIPKHHLYKGEISKDMIKVVEPIRKKYDLKKIGDHYLTDKEVNYYLRKVHPIKCIKDLEISTSHYYQCVEKYAKDKPALYTNRRNQINATETQQYKKLKRLGYENATEYVSEHGARAYKENILNY